MQRPGSRGNQRFLVGRSSVLRRCCSVLLLLCFLKVLLGIVQLQLGEFCYALELCLVECVFGGEGCREASGHPGRRCDHGHLGEMSDNRVSSARLECATETVQMQVGGIPNCGRRKKLSRLVCKLMPATQLRAQEKKNSAVGAVYLIVLSINDIASEPHIMVCLIPRQIPTTQSVHVPMVIMLIPQSITLSIACS